jgi:tape measure domain-containing protein
MFAMVLALGAGLAAAPALAQDAPKATLSAADRAGLDARIDQLNGMVEAGQFSAMIEFLPPKVLQTIADTFGVTADEARDASRQMVDELMSQVTILAFDIDRAGAETFVTPDGSRQYVVLDLTMLMETQGIQIKAVSPNLAFMDEGVWYIMDVNDPAQADILRQAYPEFEGVTFEPGTMDVIE